MEKVVEGKRVSAGGQVSFRGYDKVEEAVAFQQRHRDLTVNVYWTRDDGKRKHANLRTWEW